MSRDAARTLFHPFATEILTSPGDGERVLYLGAEDGFTLPDAFKAEVKAVQPFRPLYQSLVRRNMDVQPFVEGDGYAFTLILMSRHRGENENLIIEALKRTKDGGRIVMAGAKEDGVQSARKRLNGLGIETDHLAKYHAQAFWFTKPKDNSNLIDVLTQKEVVVDGRFATAPGMFSHNEIDPGSQFLARYLPSGFTKLAADFGAGWGYLTAALHAVSPGIEGIDLYEADYNALEAARRNISKLAPGLSARYHWLDLVREDVKSRYDLIVMNPPFHEGHAAEPGIGQAIIKRAAASLKIGGELLLVANRGLPYEPILAETFKTSGEVARNARYKVLKAKK